MPIYIEEDDQPANTIACVILAFLILAIVGVVGCLLLDREPIKERQQVVLIKSIGVWHQYTVDGKNVIVTYQESR
jgi:hypothetical protein